MNEIFIFNCNRPASYNKILPQCFCLDIISTKLNQRCKIRIKICLLLSISRLVSIITKSHKMRLFLFILIKYFQSWLLFGRSLNKLKLPYINRSLWTFSSKIGAMLMTTAGRNEKNVCLNITIKTIKTIMIFTTTMIHVIDAMTHAIMTLKRLS